MKTIVMILGVLVLLAIVAAVVTQTSSREAEFVAGHAFATMPDGFWKGDTNLPKGSWQGKTFDAATATGKNVFLENGVNAERVPFKMYNAPALWDKGLTVTRIDYDVPDNPFWLRPALDEVVEVAPGKLLGKIHYRIFGFSVPIGYFWQTQSDTINP